MIGSFYYSSYSFNSFSFTFILAVTVKAVTFLTSFHEILYTYVARDNTHFSYDDKDLGLRFHGRFVIHEQAMFGTFCDLNAQQEQFAENKLAGSTPGAVSDFKTKNVSGSDSKSSDDTTAGGCIIDSAENNNNNDSEQDPLGSFTLLRHTNKYSYDLDDVRL